MHNGFSIVKIVIQSYSFSYLLAFKYNPLIKKLTEKLIKKFQHCYEVKNLFSLHHSRAKLKSLCCQLSLNLFSIGKVFAFLFITKFLQLNVKIYN